MNDEEKAIAYEKLLEIKNNVPLSIPFPKTEETEEKEFQNLIDDVSKNIARNHYKILHDWFMAILSKSYEETGTINPRDFTLNQSPIGGKGSFEVGYKYWFTKE